MPKQPFFFIISASLKGFCYLICFIWIFPCFWYWLKGFSWSAKIVASPLKSIPWSHKACHVILFHPMLPMPRFTRRIGLLWNRLLQVKNTVGWVAQNWATFHPSTCSRLFFFKFASFLSIQRVFEPFQCPRSFFSSISEIKTSWKAINIDYPLHTEVNNLIVFLPNWVILIILWRKITQIWEIGCIITW